MPGTDCGPDSSGNPFCVYMLRFNKLYMVYKRKKIGTDSRLSRPKMNA